jgi:hypothetical protein
MLQLLLWPLRIVLEFIHEACDRLPHWYCHDCHCLFNTACENYAGPWRKSRFVFFLARWTILRPVCALPWPGRRSRRHTRDLEQTVGELRAQCRIMRFENAALRQTASEHARIVSAAQTRYQHLELAYAQLQAELEDHRTQFAPEAVREALCEMRDELAEIVDDYMHYTQRLVQGAANIEGFLERMQAIDESLAVLGRASDGLRTLTLKVPTLPEEFLGPIVASMSPRMARDCFLPYHPDKVEKLGIRWLTDLHTLISAHANAALQHFRRTNL